MKNNIQCMNIKIKLKNEFEKIDDTMTMSKILEEISQELKDGLLYGNYKNYEWKYTYKDV